MSTSAIHGALPASPAAPAALVRALDDPAHWLEAARTLTENTGFLLLSPAGGSDHGVSSSHLLVALRDRPTLRHFDPESISFYAPFGGAAAPATVTRLDARVAGRRPVLWGHVHVVDRVPVENRFLTFGGSLELVPVDDAVVLAHLSSPAPIVRWGGHSQGIDGLTLAIGAFFGRLIVPVDFKPGAAGAIDAATPDVLFAAFLDDTMRRARGTRRLVGDPTELDRWLAAAWARIRSDAAVREAASALLDRIGL